jgi:hypothetical protein
VCCVLYYPEYLQEMCFAQAVVLLIAEMRLFVVFLLLHRDLIVVYVYLLLSMYTYCYLRILRRGYPD